MVLECDDGEHARRWRKDVEFHIQQTPSNSS
jgi:hypothetical protein